MFGFVLHGKAVSFDLIGVFLFLVNLVREIWIQRVF